MSAYLRMAMDTSKTIFKFQAQGVEHEVNLEALFRPPDVTDPEYHRFLSHHYACISELRGYAKMEWQQAKLQQENVFNRWYLHFTQQFEAEAKRPTREFLRACVETQETWMAARQDELAAEKNYMDAKSLCDALWFHSKLVMAMTAGVAEVMAEEVRSKGGQS